MSCNEILPVIQDFVDHELGDDDMQRVAKHMEGCQPCTAVVGGLREMKACLRRHGRPDPAPAGLLERVGRELRGQERGRAIRWGRLAVAAVMLIAVAGLVGLRVMRPQPTPLAVAAVGVHLDRVHTQKMGHASNDCDELEEFFRQKLQLGAALPRFSPADISLKGGCLTSLMDHDSAIVFYDYKGRRATMFMLEPRGLDTSAMDAAQAASVQLICMREEYDGYQVICWKRDGVLFAMVAERSQTELGELVASAYK